MTVSIITIISFGMSVIMSFLLIPRYGAIGAACVNTIVYIAITAGLLFQFRRETKVTFSDFIITRDDYQYAKEIFRSTLQGLKA